MPESKLASGLSIPGICCGCWQPDFNLLGQADVSLILYGGIAGGAGTGFSVPAIIYGWLAVAAVKNAFNDWCQDDFHGKPHLAGRHHEGIAPRHEGIIQHV